MSCSALEDFQCDSLDIIGIFAYGFCSSLNEIVLPSIRRICRDAFLQIVIIFYMSSYIGRGIHQPIGPNAFEGCS